VSTRRAAGPLLVLSLVCAAGCAADVASRESTPRPVVAPPRIPTDAEDAALFHTVIRSITRDLKLPLPHVTVESVDGATFVETLVSQRMPPDLAQEIGVASGVAIGTRILVRSDALSRMSATERTGLYAHELAHVAQAMLGAHGAPIWIREGHATWVSYRVLERLGYRSYAESREEVRRRVRISPTPRERFPALSDLHTDEAWIRGAARIGWAATYGQAFLAVDRLVERHTVDRLHEFFRRSGGLDGRLRAVDAGSPFGNLLEQRDWNAVFPVAYRDFLAEFRTYLTTLP
jgi:hypothetical protein